jgi:hypothetical protein
MWMHACDVTASRAAVSAHRALGGDMDRIDPRLLSGCVPSSTGLMLACRVTYVYTNQTYIRHTLYVWICREL